MRVTIPTNKLKVEICPNKDFFSVEIDIPIEKIEFHGESLQEIEEFIIKKLEKEGRNLCDCCEVDDV
jgi:hypothetical protein